MKQKIIILVFLFSQILAFASTAASEYWPLEDLPKKGLHYFWEADKQRVLIQGEKSHVAFVLEDSPYAMRDGVILFSPRALIRKKNRMYISAAFVNDHLAEFSSIVIAKKEKKIKPRENESVIALESSGSGCTIKRPVKKIFIDPGHGGSDLGTAFHGVYEKDIVLKFSKLVAKEIASHGVEISFSRTKDIFLPLDIRTQIAKEWQADLFISLHMNSSPSSEANGTETYILSQDATDADARKLALKENSIVSQVKGSRPVLKDILWDMEQNAYLQASAYLASFIQKSVIETAHNLLQEKKIDAVWKNRGVRQAPFFVLSRAAMPAVLVELGYLSNEKDRKLLSDKKFQESLAKALAQGVKMYKEACKAR